jgi:hypothetical protein
LRWVFKIFNFMRGFLQTLQTIFFLTIASFAAKGQTVTITASSDTVCVGSTVTLTNTNNFGATDFVWQNPGSLTAVYTSSQTVVLNTIGVSTFTLQATNFFTFEYATTTISIVVGGPSTYTYADTICSGSTYAFNGQNLSTAGTYKDTFQNVYGCDSVVTLNLTINSLPFMPVATATSSTICQGDTTLLKVQSTASYCLLAPDPTDGDYIANVTLGGINNTTTYPGFVGYTLFPKTASTTTTLTAGSTYTISVKAGYGVDNYIAAWMDFDNDGVFASSEKIAQSGILGPNGIYTVAFTVPAGAINGDTRMRVFENYNNPNIFPCNNILYGEAEDYTVTISGGANPPTISWTPIASASTPNADSTLVFPSATTIYTVTATNNKGCINTNTISITVNMPSGSTMVDTICSNTPYTFNGQSITATGTYYDTLINAIGCDSIITLNLYAKPISNYAYADTICAGTPYTFNGQSLTTTGAYYDTLVNAIGCDSFVTLNLLVRQVPIIATTVSNDTVCQGSTVELIASITNSYVDSGFVGPFAASNMTYALGNGSDGIYVPGYDSVLLVSSTAMPSFGVKTDYLSTDTFTQSGIINFNWSYNHSWGYGPSVDNVRYTINNSTYSYLNGFSTTGPKTQSASQTITVNAGDVITFEIYDSDNDQDPCYVYLTNLTFTPTTPVAFNWAGNGLSNANNDTANAVLNIPGAQTYTVTGTDFNGCTSSATASVQVNAPSSATITDTICSGNVYVFGSQSLSASGTYYDTLVNALGCDSFITLNLTVSSPSTYTYADTICAGTPYSFNGQNLTASGTYYDTLVNAGGCDSIIALNFIVKPTPVFSASASDDTLCQGSTVTLTAPNTVYGFKGPFDPANGIFYTVGDAPNASYNFSSSLDSAIGFAGIDTSINYGEVFWKTDTILQSGVISFNWTYLSDSTYPGNMVRYKINGGADQYFNGMNFYIGNQSGTHSIVVNSGDVITFKMSIPNNRVAGQTIFSNFSFTPTNQLSYVWAGSNLTNSTGDTTYALLNTIGLQNFVVTGTDADGCSSNDTISIMVKPTPTVNATASSDTLCQGNMVSLSETTPSNIISGFVGPFDPANGTVVSNSNFVNGGFNFSNVPNSVTMVTSTVSGSNTAISQWTSDTIMESGVVTFNFTHNGNNSSAMRYGKLGGILYATVMPMFGYQLTGGVALSASIAVNAGDVIVFELISSNYFNISTVPQSTIVVSNFNFTPTTTYLWSGNDLTNSNAKNTSALPNTVGLQTYTVQVTNSFGCSNADTINVYVKPSSTYAYADTICAGTPYLFNGQNLTASGAYNDTFVNAVGCDSIVTLNLIVNPAPVLNAIASNTTACEGKTRILTVTNSVSSLNPLTFLWTGSGLANPTNDTTIATLSTPGLQSFVITGTAANGCSSTDTVTIMVNALPTLSVTATDDTVCQGNAISLMSVNLTLGTVTIPDFVGPFDPANGTFTSTGYFANGGFDTSNSPYSVTATSSSSSSQSGPGSSIWIIDTVAQDGSINFDWSYSVNTSHPAYIGRLDYSINGGAYQNLNGFTSTNQAQSGTQVITVNSGDVVVFRIYTNNFNGNCAVLLDNFSFTTTAPVPTTYLWSGNGLSNATNDTADAALNIPGVQTYTVVGTDVNGCSNSNTVSVFVTEPSTLTITDTICTGTLYTFNGQNLDTSGTYYDTLVNAAGCDSMVTLNLFVRADQAPPIIAATSQDTVCQGNGVNLTAVAGIAGFVGPFNPASGGTYSDGTVVNGGFNFSNAPNSISVVATNGPTPGPVTGTHVWYSDIVQESGWVSFSWSYTTAATSFAGPPFFSVPQDFLEVSTNNSQFLSPISGFDINSLLPQSGTYSLFINAGERLHIKMYGDNYYGAATFVISDFNFSPSSLSTATFMWNGSGLSNPNVANTGAVLNTAGAQTYTVTVTDNNGCTNSTSLDVYAYASSAQLAAITSSQTQTQADGTQITYTNNDCDVIAGVADAVSGNLLGNTISTVTIDATAQTHNSQPYCRRHYDITPANQGAAVVTLYATFADFLDYNTLAAATGWPLLPNDLNDTSGFIPNVRVTQVHGTGGLGTGVSELITPTSVTWNNTLNAWQIIVPVDSFSSFFIHTGTTAPLAINLLNFSGEVKDASDVLYWTTSSEINSDYFELQYSTDAKNFSTIASIDTKAPNGNSATALDYTYTNAYFVAGYNYYKLKSVDKSGKAQYSNTIKLHHQAIDAAVSVVPNPFTNNINVVVDATADDNVSITIHDASGRIVHTSKAAVKAGKNELSITTSDWASGIYFVNVKQGQYSVNTIKVTKL